jgi:hypothetical protein
LFFPDAKKNLQRHIVLQSEQKFMSSETPEGKILRRGYILIKSEKYCGFTVLRKEKNHARRGRVVANSFLCVKERQMTKKQLGYIIIIDQYQIAGSEDIEREICTQIATLKNSVTAFNDRDKVNNKVGSFPILPTMLNAKVQIQR